MKCEFIKKDKGGVLRLIAENEEEQTNLIALAEAKRNIPYLQTVYLGPRGGQNMATIEVAPKEWHP